MFLLSFILFYWDLIVWICKIFWYIAIQGREECFKVYKMIQIVSEMWFMFCSDSNETISMWSNIMSKIWAESMCVDSLNVDFGERVHGTSVTHRKEMFQKMLYQIFCQIFLLSFILFYWDFIVWICKILWYIAIQGREECFKVYKMIQIVSEMWFLFCSDSNETISMWLGFQNNHVRFMTS
jgi:hypothetical protein